MFTWFKNGPITSPSIACLISLGALLVLSCGNVDDQTLPELEADTQFGTLQLPLIAYSDAYSYRLHGRFLVAGPAYAEVNTADDPDATVRSLTLPPGGYDVTLLDGYYMERVSDAGPVLVESRRLSANPQRVTLSADAMTTVRFEFQVESATVSTGLGELRITIGVTECGNGVVEGQEQCDDGNDVNDDACRNDCRRADACRDCISDGPGAALLEQCDSNICGDLLSCIFDTRCIAGGVWPGACLCGTSDVSQCELDLAAQDGPCGSLIREATGETEPQVIFLSFMSTSTASGQAFLLAQALQNYDLCVPECGL